MRNATDFLREDVRERDLLIQRSLPGNISNRADQHPSALVLRSDADVRGVTGIRPSCRIDVVGALWSEERRRDDLVGRRCSLIQSLTDECPYSTDCVEVNVAVGVVVRPWDEPSVVEVGL